MGWLLEKMTAMKRLRLPRESVRGSRFVLSLSEHPAVLAQIGVHDSLDAR